jgi:hypothetical protein
VVSGITRGHGPFDLKLDKMLDIRTGGNRGGEKPVLVFSFKRFQARMELLAGLSDTESDVWVAYQAILAPEAGFIRRGVEYKGGYCHEETFAPRVQQENRDPKDT